MSTLTTRTVAALAAGLLVLGASACNDGDSVAEQAKRNPDAGYIAGDGSIVTVAPADRREPVELSGETLDGSTLDLADLRGKVVVVNTWGSWCGPCEGEAPHLVAVAERYAKDPVEMVGIDYREPSKETGAAQAKEWGFTWPSIFDQTGTTALDMQGVLKSQPATAVLDTEGRVAASVQGPVTESTLAAIIDDVLAESEGAASSSSGASSSASSSTATAKG